MDLDATKIDDAALAVLYLTLHDTRKVWKAIDWEVTDRLFAKGLILDPVNKRKRITLTDEGLQAAEAASERLFSVRPDAADNSDPGRTDGFA
ncbi:hypothetical protein ISN76_00345 [Dyella halodurans]|uniref:DUF6429 family protein n=1 Tax=Dyella halodurans TaxID=1920171 RepID=A0ABV9BXU7_9GAMM|nr:DUF6429 family protein [Dyella halodurans]